MQLGSLVFPAERRHLFDQLLHDLRVVGRDVVLFAEILRQVEKQRWVMPGNRFAPARVWVGRAILRADVDFVSF